ncbi:MAG: hypothetical protein SAK29_41700 [Scytonema sp. PMC 1069.18]|nr:hypothetical protein [Scytonema sp. PMC 1069.18]MEC4887195.1 hypothetical protein [Scytonema sp. PMC 1070.18]
MIRRFRGKSFLPNGQHNTASIMAGCVGTLNLVFIVGLPLSFWIIGIWKLVYGVPSVVIALLCLPLISAFLTLGLLVFTVLAWTNRYWSFWGRSLYSVVTLAALIFIPVLNFWNLLGFKF